MKALPLFYYPSKWIWVDDDKTLLNTMIKVYSIDNNIKGFLSAKECLDYLDHYQPPLQKYNFLRIVTEDENHGILQRNPVNFDVTSIARLADDLERHDEVTVMVIDYNMPDMDGFTLAKTLQNYSIQKILLTGMAKESQAVEGFNSSLINRFIQKSSSNMDEKITSYLRELSLQYFQELTSPLLSYLEAEMLLPLSDSIFIDFFKKYCKVHKIKEFYLIDTQGSFLCVDEAGEKSCLVVRSNSGIENWIEFYGDAINNDDLIAIKRGEKIPFFGIGREAWQIDKSLWLDNFYTANVVHGREEYFWTRVVLNRYLFK